MFTAHFIHTHVFIYRTVSIEKADADLPVGQPEMLVTPGDK